MKAIYAGVLQAFLHYNVSSRRVYSALQGSIIFLMYWLNLVFFYCFLVTCYVSGVQIRLLLLLAL